MGSRVYLDSSTIIAALNLEVGRAEVMRAALDLATAKPGELVLFTSTLTMVEVLYLLDELGVARPDSLPTIDNFWKSSPIKKVEFGEPQAHICRSLTRQRFPQAFDGRRSDMVDAMHLATARSIGVHQVWTYNPDDFRKYNGDPPSLICEPNVDQLTMDLPGMVQPT